ncbi:MAG: hypothetical protein M9947_11355 [Thermomicrobiales bacterium]|nr:hypothetical protein [Thermomicrobiales bacterium]
MTTDTGKLREPWIVTAEPLDVLHLGIGRAQLRQDPWKEWLTIAIYQHHIAARARQQHHSNTILEGDPPMRHEYHASMIALTACAHAIDGLYLEVVNITGVTVKPQDRKRHKWIYGTLRHHFADNRLGSELWKHNLAWLFVEMRDGLVHPTQMTTEDVGLHPLGMGTSPEIATYTVDAAERAVVFSLDLVEACLSSPKSESIELVTFCNQKLPLMERLRKRHSVALHRKF